MDSKSFTRKTIFITLLFLVGFASITVYIDPYFHYHKPLKSLQYPLNNERYMNDGIVKNFDYNAIITGTSMVQNFKTTECDLIFGCDSIKVPYSGGFYKEIDQNIKKAVEENKNIQIVIRALDYSFMYKEKDDARYESDFCPDYLYNNNFFDDVKYVLNKDIMINSSVAVLSYTRAGNITTSFDTYSNWNNSCSFGKDTVLDTYERKEKVDAIQHLTDDEKKTIEDNIFQNVETTAEQNPNITFYLFFTPYSICYWDTLNQAGQVQYQVETEKLVIEQLLKHKNIKLYSFSNNFDIVCDLNNYRDILHYGEWINSKILVWMKEEKYKLTYENYENYLNEIEDFYLNYDYNNIYLDD